MSEESESMLSFVEIHQKIQNNLGKDLSNNSKELLKQVNLKAKSAVDWNTLLEKQFDDDVTEEKCLEVKNLGTTALQKKRMQESLTHHSRLIRLSHKLPKVAGSNPSKITGQAYSNRSMVLYR